MTDSPIQRRATVLDEIHGLLTKYVAFPSIHSSVACTLWVAHTWVVIAFFTTPRLIIQSPEPGSGKTRLLELLAILCRDAKLTMSTSAAALYRRIGGSENPPTVLADEADTVFSRNATAEAEALRAIYNSGYRKGATVDRCEGDGAKMKVTEFKVYAPVAIAGLGTMPRTITTRGIVNQMRKRAPSEQVAPFRERQAIDEAAPIVTELAAWATGAIEELQAARPEMPDGVVDRPAEVWEPLLAVAESLGNDEWKQRTRAACTHFVITMADEAASVGVRLLADLHHLYHPFDDAGDPLEPLTEMHSAEIIEGLTKEADSPWRDLFGKPIDQRRLASELRKYGVRPKQIRIGERSAKGYQIEPHSGPDGQSAGLFDAWARYLPSDERNIRNKRNNAGQDVSDNGPVSDASETTSPSETKSEPLTSSVSEVSDVSDKRQQASPTPASMPRQRHLTPVHSRRRFRPPAGPDRCSECGWHTATMGHKSSCPAKSVAMGGAG